MVHGWNLQYNKGDGLPDHMAGTSKQGLAAHNNPFEVKPTQGKFLRGASQLIMMSTAVAGAGMADVPKKTQGAGEVNNAFNKGNDA